MGRASSALEPGKEGVGVFLSPKATGFFFDPSGGQAAFSPFVD